MVFKAEHIHFLRQSFVESQEYFIFVRYCFAHCLALFRQGDPFIRDKGKVRLIERLLKLSSHIFKDGIGTKIGLEQRFLWVIVTDNDIMVQLPLNIFLLHWHPAFLLNHSSLNNFNSMFYYHNKLTNKYKKISHVKNTQNWYSKFDLESFSQIIIDSNNLNLKRMENSHLIIAHRGYCSIFPENTLESF